MLKRVQHDKKKCVIPNLFRNLEFGNYNKSIASALVPQSAIPACPAGRRNPKLFLPPDPVPGKEITSQDEEKERSLKHQTHGRGQMHY
jgi:hypothetical protein